jgi:hypothetical protein
MTLAAFERRTNRRGVRNINLGPLETIKDIEDGIRIQAKLLAVEGDYAASVQALRTLLSSKYRAKELELKGMNLRVDEGQTVQFTVTDYSDRYLQEVGKNKELSERVEALEAQIAVMQGKDRPRPPRPLN